MHSPRIAVKQVSENRVLLRSCLTKLNDGAVILSPPPSPPLPRTHLNPLTSVIDSCDNRIFLLTSGCVRYLPHSPFNPAQSAPLRCRLDNCRSRRTKTRPGRLQRARGATSLLLLKLHLPWPVPIPVAILPLSRATREPYVLAGE